MKLPVSSFLASHVLSGFVSTYLLLSGSLVALGQSRDSKAPIKTQSGARMAVGSFVVPKSSDVALRDDARQVRIDDYLAVKVERIDGDRLLVSGPDGRSGWLSSDQVVPFDQAMDYFDQAIAKTPQNADAHWRRGRLWDQRSDNDRALSDFDEAIRLAPNHARCYDDRSGVLVRKEQFDRALADCDKAIQLEPKFAKAYLHRATVWLWKKEPKRAKGDFDMAIQLDPTKWYYWSERSRFYSTYDGNLDNAISDMTEAIRLFPSNPILHYFRGDLWTQKGQNERAIADFSEAIRRDPDSENSFLRRAMARESLGQLDQAIADFTEAIKINPRRARHFHWRGATWSEKREFDKAIADFTEAIARPKARPASESAVMPG